MENENDRPSGGRSSGTPWRSSTASDYDRSSWTVRYLADREHVLGTALHECNVPDVDELAVEVTALYGPDGAVRYAKQMYAAVMRAAGRSAA